VLDVLPDSAPPSLRTITKSELAGEGAKFVFSKTPIDGLSNDLTARFKKAYSRLGSESEWDGTAKTSDSASIAKYGSYPKDFWFEAIREQAMADNALAYILKQRKQPYLVVEFPVFYDHFDLTVGDTIELDNPRPGLGQYDCKGHEANQPWAHKARETPLINNILMSIILVSI